MVQFALVVIFLADVVLSYRMRRELVVARSLSHTDNQCCLFVIRQCVIEYLVGWPTYIDLVFFDREPGVVDCRRVYVCIS